MNSIMKCPNCYAVMKFYTEERLFACPDCGKFLCEDGETSEKIDWQSRAEKAESELADLKERLTARVPIDIKYVCEIAEVEGALEPTGADELIRLYTEASKLFEEQKGQRTE